VVGEKELDMGQIWLGRCLTLEGIVWLQQNIWNIGPRNLQEQQTDTIYNTNGYVFFAFCSFD